jgi:hypothetical protein
MLWLSKQQIHQPILPSSHHPIIPSTHLIRQHGNYFQITPHAWQILIPGLKLSSKKSTNQKQWTVYDEEVIYSGLLCMDTVR